MYILILLWIFFSRVFPREMGRRGKFSYRKAKVWRLSFSRHTCPCIVRNYRYVVRRNWVVLGPWIQSPGNSVSPHAAKPSPVLPACLFSWELNIAKIMLNGIQQGLLKRCSLGSVELAFKFHLTTHISILST